MNKRMKFFSRVASAIVMLVGGIVLMGWGLNLPVLKPFLSFRVAMSADTAFCFLLSGVSVWLLRRETVSRSNHLAGLIFAGIVGLVGLLTFSKYLFDGDPGGSLYSGQMGPGTALNFLMAGIALTFLNLESERGRWVSEFLTAMVIFFTLLSVTRYAYGVESLQGFFSYTHMGMASSLVFIILFTGLLGTQPNSGLMGIVTSPTMGGFMVRRLLPVAVVVPFGMGWLRLLGEQTGLYSAEFRIAFFAVLNMAVYTIAIFWNARLLFQIDMMRKRAEETLRENTEELKRSNQELEQFASVASHDLQEPLRMITSYTKLLAKRYQGKLGPDADEFIGYAVDGAAWMRTLINSLLTYARIDTRGKSFKLIDCDIVLADAMTNLRIAITQRRARVTHDSLPTVRGDRIQLVQLFQNLIDNALKFQDDKVPEVHIGVEQRGQEWLFSVRDNGIGIAPEHFERVFQVFQRLHTRDEYPGTGIGLAVCKKIVERHGGRIWAESEPGKGTAFNFTTAVIDLSQPKRMDKHEYSTVR